MQERIQIWRDAYEGDDNAIVPTLVTFTWNYAAYMSVARMVEAAPDDESGGKQLNFLVVDLLQQSYWGGAGLAIRRLLDKSPLDGQFGVCSLRSLISDVQKNRDKLTRRVFVEDIAGLDYDYEVIEQRALDYLKSQSGRAVWIPPELDSDSSRTRHELFDFLSGVNEDGRSEDDLILTSVFERLEERLSRLDHVAEHATVHFAHASTKASRAGRELAAWGTEDAKAALQLLVETAELVGRWFVNSGVGDTLPHPQYDQFSHLDKPMASASALTSLQQQWDDFASEVALWPMIEDSKV